MGRISMLAVALSHFVLAPLPLSAQSPLSRQSEPRAEVMVVGVYHMSNPGSDVFNIETDDVLSATRQAEIAQVAAVLREFRPTKIAVEVVFSDRGISQRYAGYVAGTYELTHNEVDQLGFRVARELGHGTVYPVDVRGEFPYPRLVKYAQATGQTPAFDALAGETGEAVNTLSTYMASHTVLETLLYMNSDERVGEAVGSYFRLAEFGEPWDWAGADLVSDWFRRNMRIYTNIVQLIDSPEERILVIYGAGHLGWLQDAFGSNPSIRLRKLAEFAPASATAQASPELSPEARIYLTSALDTIEAVTLNRDTLPWPMIRDSAMYHAYGARKPADTYGAIDWALRRANKHSFLQAPQPGAVSEVIDGSFGYIRVPQRGGAAIALADSLHAAVRALEAQAVCGWVVDLRGNGGGNMWPMLAGIGPLLGDSIVGYFGVSPEAQAWYYRRGASGVLGPSGEVDTVSQVTVEPVELRFATPPVAVLVDGGTGSSGEALAVAFRGRPNTRSFGSPTAGFATVNRGSRLPDGGNMVVTTGYYGDRLRTPVDERLEPDEVVSAGVHGWPFPTDRVARTGMRWLALQPACNGKIPEDQREEMTLQR